jgi:hypothetical protein
MALSSLPQFQEAALESKVVAEELLPRVDGLRTKYQRILRHKCSVQSPRNREQYHFQPADNQRRHSMWRGTKRIQLKIHETDTMQFKCESFQSSINEA